MLRPDLSPSPAHQTPHLPGLETDDYRLAQGRRDGRRGTLSHRNWCPARGSAVTSSHECRPPWPGNGHYHGLSSLQRWSPVATQRVIRFADDLVVLHRDYHAIAQAQDIAACWLQEMGLTLKPSKTRIGHTLDPVEGRAGVD